MRKSPTQSKEGNAKLPPEFKNEMLTVQGAGVQLGCYDGNVNALNVSMPKLLTGVRKS